MSYKYLLSLILISLFFSTIHPNKVLAQEYIVKSYIVIPANFDKPQIKDKIPEYKNNIIRALKDVQTWYSDKLSSHTFRFSQDIEVIKAKKETYSVTSTVKMYDEIEGDQLVPWDRGTIKIVWLIGSNDSAGQGQHGDDEGRGWLSHWLLTQIGDPNSGNRNHALGVLAHELGHAFGLVFSGYAKAHPCTVNYPNECIDIAPKPYPDLDESFGSVMSYGGHPRYPNTGFNNSIYNPEKWKLYQIAFINPNKDPAPAPSNASRSVIKVFSSPFVVKPGNLLSISTSDKKDNFGSSIGEVEITFSGITRRLTDIKKWNDKSIEILLPEDIIPDGTKTTNANLRINTAGNEYQTGVFLQGRDKKLATININFTLSCGENHSPYRSVKVNLYLIGPPDKTIESAFTNSEGVSNIILTDPETGRYRLEIDPEEKLYNPNYPRYVFFSVEKNNDKTDFNLKLDHPLCPSPKPTPQTTSTIIPFLGEQNTDVGSTSLGSNTEQKIENNIPKQIIISNDEDFIVRKNAQAEEITNTEVIENPEEQKQVVWTPPEKGSGDETFVRVIEKDGDVKDYQANLNDGDSTEIAGVKIVAKIAKKVKEIDAIPVGDESNKTILYTLEGGYQNPETELKNDLNLFKIVTIYNDDSQEEDSSFYIEKNKPAESIPETTTVPEASSSPIQSNENNTIGSCVLDDNLGRKVVVPIDGNPFDCATQNQICEEYTNNEGKQDTHCVDAPTEGQ